MERTALLLLLVSCVIVMTVECFEKLVPCTTGAACYPNRTVPEGLRASHPDYYCCLDRYRTLKLRKRKKTGTYKCWCRHTVKLERSVQGWAESSKDGGRMCLREEQCRLENRWPSVRVIVKRRFLYCCYGSGTNKENKTYSLAKYIPFDNDKEEFIACRCAHQPLPTPDPEASAVVQPVSGYRSSGETCSYDAGCEDMPLLKCQSQFPSNVTFCCYGSRGMVTQNDADNVTRCTCTHSVYGAQCDTTPPTTPALSTTRQNTNQITTATAGTTIQQDASQITTTTADTRTLIPCLTNCKYRAKEDMCIDSHQTRMCCPHNMAVVANQSAGRFTSCTCLAQTLKWCGRETSVAARFNCRLAEVISLVFAVYLLGQSRWLIVF